MNHMKKLEKEGGSTAVLNSMKTEMGIPLDEKVGDQGIDVPTALLMLSERIREVLMELDS